MRLLPLLSLLAAASLAACGPVPSAPPQEAEAAKQFVPPPPGTAFIYIYRTGSYASYWTTSVTFAGIPSREFKTRMPTDAFMRITSKPGVAVIGCVVADLPDRHEIRIEPGQVRYFAVTLRQSTYSPYCLVQEVSPDWAQPLIRPLPMVEPL